MLPPSGLHLLAPSQNSLLQEWIKSRDWMAQTVHTPAGPSRIKDVIEHSQSWVEWDATHGHYSRHPNPNPVRVKGGAAWDLYATHSQIAHRPRLHDVDIGIGVSSVQEILALLNHLRLAHCIDTHPHFRKSRSPDVDHHRFSLLYNQGEFIGCSFTLPSTIQGGLDLDFSIMLEGTSGYDYVHSDLEISLTPNLVDALVHTPHGHSLNDVINARIYRHLSRANQDVVDVHWRFIKWVGRGYQFDEDVLQDAAQSLKSHYDKIKQDFNARRYTGMAPDEKRQQLSVLSELCRMNDLDTPHWVKQIIATDQLELTTMTLSASRKPWLRPSSTTTSPARFDSPLSLAPTASPPPKSPQDATLQEIDAIFLRIDRQIDDKTDSLQSVQLEARRWDDQQDLTEEQHTIKRRIDGLLSEQQIILDDLTQKRDQLLTEWESPTSTPDEIKTRAITLENMMKDQHSSLIHCIRDSKLSLSLLITAEHIETHRKKVNELQSKLDAVVTSQPQLNKNQRDKKSAIDTMLKKQYQEIETWNKKLHQLQNQPTPSQSDDVQVKIKRMEDMLTTHVHAKNTKQILQKIGESIDTLSQSLSDSHRDRAQSTPSTKPSIQSLAPPTASETVTTASETVTPASLSDIIKTTQTALQELVPNMSSSIRKDYNKTAPTYADLQTECAALQTEVDNGGGHQSQIDHLKSKVDEFKQWVETLRNRVDQSKSDQQKRDASQVTKADAEVLTATVALPAPITTLAPPARMEKEAPPAKHVVKKSPAKGGRPSAPKSATKPFARWEDAKNWVETNWVGGQIAWVKEWGPSLGMPPSYSKLQDLLISERLEGLPDDIKIALESKSPPSIDELHSIKDKLEMEPVNHARIVGVIDTYIFLSALNTMIENEDSLKKYLTQQINRGNSQHVLFDPMILSLSNCIKKCLREMTQTWKCKVVSIDIINILLERFQIPCGNLINKIDPAIVTRHRNVFFKVKNDDKTEDYNTEAYKLWVESEVIAWITQVKQFNRYGSHGSAENPVLKFSDWDEVWIACIQDLKSDSNEAHAKDIQELIDQALDYLFEDNNTKEFKEHHWNFLIKNGNLLNMLLAVGFDEDNIVEFSDTSMKEKYVNAMHQEIITRLQTNQLPNDITVKDCLLKFLNGYPISEDNQERLKTLLLDQKIATELGQCLAESSVDIFSLTMMQMIFCFPEEHQKIISDLIDCDQMVCSVLEWKQDPTLFESHRSLILKTLALTLDHLLRLLSETKEIELIENIIKLFEILSVEEKNEMLPEAQKTIFLNSIKLNKDKIMASMGQGYASDRIQFEHIITFKKIHAELSNGNPFITEEEKTKLIRLLQDSARDLLNHPSRKEKATDLLDIHATYRELFPDEKEGLWSEETRKATLEKWPVSEVKLIWEIFFTEEADYRKWVVEKINLERAKLRS